MTTPVKVAVTGAAGQISYSLLFRLAAGDVFGADVPVELRLIEIDPAMRALEGVVMELDDCAFPNLVNVVTTSDLKVGFDGVNWALLIGSVPRKQGMERRDLLGINGGIFKPQGEAIASAAANDVRVLVVGNPCNTNCLIARENGKDVPADRWFSMMRLDQNRAMTQLARKANRPVTSVTKMAIWGNHSATQFPDFYHAEIDGVEVPKVIDDHDWLNGEFITTVQKRGAAIIEARGASSAASAANAVIDTVRSIATPTPAGDWTSVGVVSRGEYGVPEGLQFGFPIRSTGSSWEVVTGLVHTQAAQSAIDTTRDELLGEQSEVTELLS
ncbi:malate dehydrogenase [Ferrimicrobium acidiphilum]|jgi:malate dehydrogenase|uniref:Malate dehydrogenase n=1 Tax=Ferrimicrobium acidiphilum DSM 19497 TaxID=1121877 RepID=A0A0D8FV66_9ACTN|nr:malate dehydrogenase [Ferrimicrobium acidiphilum]KJE77001.1 malate dehydrogenase [Ferrimicrobium acidiphilum DSM 19497]